MRALKSAQLLCEDEHVVVRDSVLATDERHALGHDGTMDDLNGPSVAQVEPLDDSAAGRRQSAD